MSDKVEGVKVLRRWPGTVEILLEDFERMEALIASQAAEIESLRADAEKWRSLDDYQHAQIESMP